MRSFLALELPEEALNALEGWSKELREMAKGVRSSLRWTRRNQYHMTLRFFGDITNAEAKRIQEVVSNVIEGKEALALEAGGLGAFSNWKRPRVLWAGLKTKNDDLQTLFEELDDGFADAGFGHHDQKVFRPHITLARAKYSEPQELSRLFSEQKQWLWGETYQVDSLVLFQSELRPTGAVYTPVKTWKLGK